MGVATFAVLATAAGIVLVPQAATAVPVSGYNIDISMRATVNEVTGGGLVSGAGVEREFSVDELPHLPMGLGDEIFFRWRVRPGQAAINCPSGADTISLGGATEGIPDVGESCVGPLADVAEFRLADGRTFPAGEIDFDGIPFGFGPVLSRDTGEVLTLSYGVLEALAGVPAGCDYAYAAGSDTIVTSGTGECNAGLRGLTGFFLREDGGAAVFDFDVNDANDFHITGNVGYGFDAQWTVRQARRVPEPGAVGLLALGALAIAAARCRVRKQASPSRR